MAQAAISQGNAYNNNNKQRIIKQGFRTGPGGASSSEGFVDMIGANNVMDSLNESDRTLATDRITSYNANVSQYKTDYAALTAKTKNYINDSSNSTNTEKNYNVFINKSQTQSQIADTLQQGCVSASSVSGLTLASGFATAYPANFLNYAAAKDACKLWAADSGKTVFAINKDSVGKYQCSTGTTLPTALQKYTVSRTLYTVKAGSSSSNTSTRGGLFANGQIGIYNSGGNNNVGAVGPVAWNIQNMTAVTLLRKYNSNDYSGGPAAKMTDPGWGTAGGGHWGQNVFPNDKNAWWISIDNVNLYGVMGYFYYVYYSQTAKNINIYMVIDDNGTLKLNGTDLGIAPSSTGNKVTLNNVHLVAGKNVFEFKLINTGGPGAFVFYASGTDNTILFRSGDPGWAVSANPVSGFDLVTNSSLNPAIPYDILTVNSVPAGYAKCDPLIGGSINKSSINASFGRNCSNQTLPPVNIRYVKIMTNAQGDYLQISQVIVNSLVNGVITNVAPRGTTTALDTYNGIGSNKDRPIDGLTTVARPYPYIYHSAGAGIGWWQLDLGRDYPVTEIIYANRTDCCASRAIGSTMTATSSSNTQYGPVTLSGALLQSFNISAGGFVASS